MIETGKIINGDCVEVMKTLPEGEVDLIVTSPPYGVGIDYDVHEDDVPFDEYVEFAKNWLTEAYRVLKPNGVFLCLEFSEIEGIILKKFYDVWSFNVLPLMGKVVLTKW